MPCVVSEELTHIAGPLVYASQYHRLKTKWLVTGTGCILREYKRTYDHLIHLQLRVPDQQDQVS